MSSTERVINRLVDHFRELRKAWFDAQLYQGPHDRIWEEEDEEKAREESNQKLKALYDQQTEEILMGTKTHPIAPRCPADVYGSRK